MYTPPDRLFALREMGVSLVTFFFQSFPLHLIFAALVFGIGYGVGFLFS